MTHHRNRIAMAAASIVLCATAMVAQSRAIVPTAESLISAALKTAKAEDKVVFVDFGASWCVWCHRLDDAFQSPELRKIFADNYVVVHLSV